MTAEERIKKALEIVNRFGNSSNNGHHNVWILDQMVRALTDCPVVEMQAVSYKGEPYTFEGMVESDEYQKWVADHKDGEDGPETYDWEEGIAP